MSALLEVSGLTVEFATRRGVVQAVRKVDINVEKGETLGIVGESGSGKSVTSYAVMRILDRAGRIAEGSIRFSGLELQNAPEREMVDLRGREISMIFQNPRAALNPIRRVASRSRTCCGSMRRRAPLMRARRPSRPCGRCASRVPRNAIGPIRSSCRAACASVS